MADQIVNRYRQDIETGEPIGASQMDHHAITILRTGPARYPRPEPMVNDALHLYLKEHLREGSVETDLVNEVRRIKKQSEGLFFRRAWLSIGPMAVNSG